MNSSLNFGILSTARIAREFCVGNRGNSRIKIAAVASRNLESAQSFAKEQGIAKAYGSYEALLGDPEIEAVYIPLPNHLHAEWTIKAARHGKHVLCEKPLALSEHEAASMFAAAKTHGVMLLEAYPYWFQPHLRQVLDWVHGADDAGGEIGAVRSMQAHLSFPLINRASDIRAKPETGGGAIWDLGCYCVSLSHLVMRDLPTRVRAVPVWSTPDPVTRVDVSMNIALEYPLGRSAHLSMSMCASRQRRAVIYGERGVIETSFPNHTADHASVPADLYPTLWRGSWLEQECQPSKTPVGNGFALEAQMFADLVQNGDHRRIAQAQAASMAVVKILAAAKRSAISGQALTLS